MVRRIVSVVTAAMVAVTVLAVPASAAGADGQARYYLALGDSLAFGYQPTRVFDQGYVQQLYASLHAKQPHLVLDNLGCPGETSQTLVAGGRCPYPGGASQLDTALAFLRAHRGKVHLITIAVNLLPTVLALRHAAPGAIIAGMTYYDTVLAAWLTGPAGQALAKQSIP